MAGIAALRDVRRRVSRAIVVRTPLPPAKAATAFAPHDRRQGQVRALNTMPVYTVVSHFLARAVTMPCATEKYRVSATRSLPPALTVQRCTIMPADISCPQTRKGLQL